MRTVLLLSFGLAGPVQLAAQTYLVVVLGLGGEERYRNRFHDWGSTMVTAAVERFGLDSDHVVFLGEKPEQDPLMAGRSTRENVIKVLSRLADSAPPGAEMFIVLAGHGSFRDGVSKFNLPGPDLTAREFGALLERFGSRSVTVVNLSSASGGFIEQLAGPNRVLITATASGYERNETLFGGYFVEAYAGDVADLDKDGRVSVLEAFQYATNRVDRYYEEEKLLKSEHAMLDDNGDGKGSKEPGVDSADGSLAAVTFLHGVRGVAAGTEASPVGSELQVLERRRLELEKRVAELRRLKSTMPEAEYRSELERLLLELATVSRKIRKLAGGEGM